MPPSNRCGYVYTDETGASHCCYRATELGTGRCFWHSEPQHVAAADERTPAAHVDAEPAAGPTCLDGASLADVSFPDGVDLRGVSLRDADLSGAQLRDATLTGADLEHADLSGATLSGATLAGANLADARLTDADLSGATLEDATLVEADLSDADGRAVAAAGATLRDATLDDANLRDADLSTTDCWDADFREAELLDADLDGATLRDAEFTSAVLRRASLVGADVEGASLVQTDLYDADLSDARLYGAVLGSARVNAGTVFDDLCVYDPARDDQRTSFDDAGPPPLTRAVGTYHELEAVCSQNALLTAFSRYFVRRQDIHTHAHLEAGRIGRWLRARGSRAVILYGESPFRVVAAALGIVLVSAVLYPLGLLRSAETGALLTYPPPTQPVELASVVADSLYFSVLAFTTMTYGYYVPVGFGKLLTVLETGAGVVLLALLVFVFGRRATR